MGKKDKARIRELEAEKDALISALIRRKPSRGPTHVAEAPLHLYGQEVIMQVHQAEGEEPVARYYDPTTKKLIGEGKVRRTGR